MAKVLTRKELDVMQCQHPGCTHENHNTVFFLHARCHEDADCEVSYDNATGLLNVVCGFCGSEIATLKIAAK